VRTRLGRLLVARPDRLDDALVASFAATTSRNVPSIIRFVSRAIDLRGRVRDGTMLAPHWAGLRVPVTFIWGDQDRADGPNAGEQIVKGLTGSALVRIPDAGHQPALDDPAAVVRAIRAAVGTPVRTTSAL
jgi:pimeloyl-ACP methyl ester carboxylesterase